MWTSIFALASLALAEYERNSFKLKGGPNSGSTVQVSNDQLAATGEKPWTYIIIDGGLVAGQDKCQGLLTFAADESTLAISHNFVYNGALFLIADQVVYLNGVDNFYQCTGSGNTIAWANTSVPAGCSGATKVQLLAYDVNDNPLLSGGDTLESWV